MRAGDPIAAASRASFAGSGAQGPNPAASSCVSSVSAVVRGRTFVIAAAAACATLAFVSPALAAPPGLPDPEPVPSLPEIEPLQAASTRLVAVPSGCAAPAPEKVVFTGNVTVTDSVTARFQVVQVLAGSTAGYEVSRLIDVRYGDDVRFLQPGTTYIVGAGVDPDTGVLFSNVRPPAPLFGGSDVAGVNVSDVDCPQVEDPIRTLTADGRSVESGVLTPLSGSKGDLLRAVLQPLGVAFLVIVGLAALKHLVFAVGRALWAIGDGDVSARKRRSRQRLSARSPRA